MHSIIRTMMTIGEHGSSRSLAFGVCLHSSIILCLLSRHTPLISGLLPGFTASGVSFIDFHDDLCCFVIYISRLLMVSLKHDCTPYFTFTTSHLLFQVQAALAPATPMPSSQFEVCLRLAFVISLNLIWSSRA